MKKIQNRFYLYACLCFCSLSLTACAGRKKWQYEWDGAEQCYFLGGF